MEWDLGIQGVGLLLLMSVGFGVAAQLLMWKVTPHWWWAFATAVYFASGVVVSEMFFGWATEEDLQPNIDGLSYDEVMLLGTLMAVGIVVVGWLVTRRVHTGSHA